MKLNRLRFLPYLLLAIPSALLTFAVLRRPEEISMRLLRTGGRIVKDTTENVPRVAAILAVLVVALWFVILIGCIREFARTRNSPDQPPES